MVMVTDPGGLSPVAAALSPSRCTPSTGAGGPLRTPALWLLARRLHVAVPNVAVARHCMPRRPTLGSGGLFAGEGLTKWQIKAPSLHPTLPMSVHIVNSLRPSNIGAVPQDHARINY